EGKLWVAYPKATSKITSDLNRDCTWEFLTQRGFESGEKVGLDYVWSALLFTKNDCLEAESKTDLVKSSGRKALAVY
ncbi:MAG: hypothetical protein ABIR19_09900, partial [Ginsengibacter sp.]